MTCLISPDLELAGHNTAITGNRGQCMGALVDIRSDHDHYQPSLQSRLPLKWTSSGQTSVGAMPRSYQVTPEILGRRRATKRVLVRR